MKLKLVLLVLMMIFLMSGCSEQDNIQNIIKEEVLCNDKADYSKLIEKYKDYLPEEVLSEFRSRYSYSQIESSHGEKEICMVSMSENLYIYMTEDDKESYSLTVVKTEEGKMTSYETFTLYEV